MVSFWNGLHWPVGDLDLGVGGVSYVELLILYELWAGERLSLEKARPRCLRPRRPFSVSAVPFGPGIDIWRSCRYVGAMMRSLCLLPGGLGRFVPCSVGANHCGHGLTLLGLFRYPPGSGRALLAGTLPLRSCFDRFACRTLLGGCLLLVVLLIWLLPMLQMGIGLFLQLVVGRFLGFAILVCEENEVDSTEKPQHTLQVLMFDLGHVCGNDCNLWIFLVIPFLITRGGAVIRIMRGSFLLRPGQAWVNSLGCACPRLQA